LARGAEALRPLRVVSGGDVRVEARIVDHEGRRRYVFSVLQDARCVVPTSTPTGTFVRASIDVHVLRGSDLNGHVAAVRA
jgi:hypothetical protein